MAGLRNTVLQAPHLSLIEKENLRLNRTQKRQQVQTLLRYPSSVVTPMPPKGQSRRTLSSI